MLDGKTGKIISDQLGVSEPTVSRHVSKVRDHLRETIMQVVMQYSFTPEEESEPAVAGMGGDTLAFDSAVSEAYHSHQLFLGKESEGA